MSPAAAARSLASIAAALRKAALGYPEAVEDTPWGDKVAKVRGKIFVFCGAREGKLYFTAKLPDSARLALTFPFAEPTGYGLGKSGWVTARFEDPKKVPVDMLRAWIDESYRAVAPKALVKTLDAGPNLAATCRPASRSAASRAKKKRASR